MSDNWKSIGELADEAVSKHRKSESAYRALIDAMRSILNKDESRFTANDICTAILVSPSLSEATLSVMLLDDLDATE